jgi:DNA-binding beta-propeller fold protein YncE
MSNKLVRVRQVSIGTDTSEVDFSGQQQIQTILGLTDGAGIAVDASRHVYVADPDQHVIFRYREGMTSQIWAGATNQSGDADGQGSEARFNNPTYLAVDRTGFLYVVDSGNGLIRRIDQNANVFTVAAIPAVGGGDQIGGIAIDDSGNIYIVDNTP